MIISDMVQRSYARCSPEETSPHQEHHSLIQDLAAGPLDFETVKRGYDMSTSCPPKRLHKKREDSAMMESSVYTSQLIGKQRFLLPWNAGDNPDGKGNKQVSGFNAEEACGMAADSARAGTSTRFSTTLDNHNHNYLYGSSFQMKARKPHGTTSSLYQRNSDEADLLDQALKECRASKFSAVEESSWDEGYFDKQCNFTKTSEFVKPKVSGRNAEATCGDASYVVKETVSPRAKRGLSSQDGGGEVRVLNAGAASNINLSLQSYCYNFLTLTADVHEEPHDALPLPAAAPAATAAAYNVQRSICSNSQSPENSEDIFTDED